MIKNKKKKMAKNDDIDFGKDESMPHEVKMVITGIIAFICLVIFLIFLFGAWYTVDAGDRAILLTFGKASTDIAQPGLHFKIPIFQSVVVYSIRTQTIKFDNPLKAGITTPSEYDALSSASKDLQTVQTAVIVNYHINEKDVLNIYQQYGTPETYQTNILEPIIRNSVKAATAHYNAQDLVDNRSEVVDEVMSSLTNQFISKNAVLDNFNVVNFAYSDIFTASIENKAVQVQNALAEQNKLVAVQYQAQQRVAQATGESEAIKTQISAIAAQGGTNYLTMLWIQKWNGQVALVQSNDAMPIIDMRSLNTAAGITTTLINRTN